MPQTSRLAAAIEKHRNEIVKRFVDGARAAGASEALPPDIIIDSLHAYLTELASRIESETNGGEAAETSAVATTHGEQRFLTGYDVGAIVREYGALRELLCDVVEKEGNIPFSEVRILFRLLIGGIADAAERYGALRDEELQKRTRHHIAFLAHELRNPLSSATMAAGLLRERGGVEGSRAFGALERGLTRVASLIDDALVDVSLLELDELELDEVSLDALLREVAVESEVDAQAKGVSLVAEGEGMTQANVKVLRSAISNLVRNAVKFSHSGGRVAVRGRVSEGRTLIEVEDTCGGLPEETLKKLFDPFVQAGQDRSGFGLGLAIAKQAAIAHRGDIRVHNLPNRGCVFVLDLPREPAGQRK